MAGRMQSVPPSLTMMPLDGMIARAFEVPGKSRLLPMEGMRGFSAALVFVVHLNTLFGELAPAGIRRIVEVAGAFGHCGVDVFFALSGFIIYGCLIEKPIQYRAFVKKRIARLYPVFGAVLGLYLVLIAITGRKAIPRFGWESAAYLLANFLLLPGILPITPIITAAWSLSY